MFCDNTRPRYQVSMYRTIRPLVLEGYGVFAEGQFESRDFLIEYKRTTKEITVKPVVSNFYRHKKKQYR